MLKFPSYLTFYFTFLFDSCGILMSWKNWEYVLEMSWNFVLVKVWEPQSSRKTFSAGSPLGYWNSTSSSPNWFLVARIQVIAIITKTAKYAVMEVTFNQIYWKVRKAKITIHNISDIMPREITSMVLLPGQYIAISLRNYKIDTFQEVPPANLILLE